MLRVLVVVAGSWLGGLSPACVVWRLRWGVYVVGVPVSGVMVRDFGCFGFVCDLGVSGCWFMGVGRVVRVCGGFCFWVVAFVACLLFLCLLLL